MGGTTWRIIGRFDPDGAIRRIGLPLSIASVSFCSVSIGVSSNYG
jgi:hypothetical protein